MARAEMGYLGYYNKYKQSPFERFDVGGDGMTGYNIYGYDVIGLRGYSDGSLTPYDPQDPYAYANVYNKYTLELRYPFLQQPATHIYGLVFAEAGNGLAGIRPVQTAPFARCRHQGIYPVHRDDRPRLGLRIRRYGPLLETARRKTALLDGYGFLKAQSVE